MSDVNNGPVMTGESFAGLPNAVPIYVIMYGPWSGAQLDQFMFGAVENLLASMDDTTYGALIGSYAGSNGPASKSPVLYRIWQDTGESVGNSINPNNIASEISAAIAHAPFPKDPNGIYLLLPDETINVTLNPNEPYCLQSGGGYSCGVNHRANLSDGTVLQYALVGDAVGCQGSNGKGCAWGFPTPNDAGLSTNGVIDGELDTIAHEIAERMTDPGSSSSGWTTTSYTGIDQDQMADLCDRLRSASTGEGNWFALSTQAGTVYANYHTTWGDFMIQTLRASEGTGSPTNGFCANSYGGVFWGQNFGYAWSPTNPLDWAPDFYKGECASEQPMIGISKLAHPARGGLPQYAHAVFCDPGTGSSAGNANFFNDFAQTGSQCNAIGMVQEYDDGDWDSGPYTLGECGQSQFIAGVDQSTSGVMSGMLCCSSLLGTVRHLSCNTQYLDSSNVTSYDWDYNYLKAQCNAGQYMAGVSSDSTGSPHAIYCCTP